MTTIGTDPDDTAERLGSRFDELRRRFEEAREKLDVRGYIADHPWRAIAVGLLAGVVLGSFGGGHAEKRRREREPERGKITEAAIAGISALGMSLLKELASKQAKSLFEKWQSRHSQEPASPYAG